MSTPPTEHDLLVPPSRAPAAPSRHKIANGGALPPSRANGCDPIAGSGGFVPTGRHVRLQRFSLVFVPLVAAALALARLPTRYQGTLVYSIAPHSDPPAIADPTSVRFDLCRKTLLDVAWRTTPALGRPIPWVVEADAAQNQLRIGVVADSTHEVRRRLDALAQCFAGELSRQESERMLREAARERSNWSRREAIEASMAQLRSEPNSSVPSATGVVESLTAEFDGLHACGDQYRRNRELLDTAVAQRESLRRAPPPIAVAVDPEARRQAYAADVVLQGDLRHLHIQLAQIRAIMLGVRDSASGHLADFLDACAVLAAATGSSDAPVSADSQALLERTAKIASDLLGRAETFAQDWSRFFIGLEGQAIDPAAPRMPDLHDRVTGLLTDYLRDASTLLTALRLRIRAMSERSEESARDHVLLAAMTRTFHRLEAAYGQLEFAGAELDPRNNYLLDASLKSARGLAHRSDAIRRELDGKLEDAQRQRASRERQEKIDALTTRIDELRQAVGAHVEAMLMTHETMRRGLQLLPASLVAETAQAKAHGQLELLQSQLRGLEANVPETAPHDDVRLDADSPRLLECSVDERPVNLATLVGLTFLAWGAALLALLGLFRLVGPPRRQLQ